MQARAIAIGLVVASLALLAGCGSSSSSSKSDTAKFKSQLTSIQGELGQTANALFTAVPQMLHQTPAQIEQTFTALSSRWRSEVSRLKALNPPSSVAKQWHSVLAAASEVQTQLERVVAGAKQGKRPALQAGAPVNLDVAGLGQAAAPVMAKLGIK